MASKPRSVAPPKSGLTVHREKLAADPEAERCVLAFLLLGGEEVGSVAAEHFSLHQHRVIWSAMENVRARGAVVERPSVAAELVESKNLDAAGGLSYLVDLENGTGIHASADITP